MLPYRVLCPGGSPGKNTGVGCHALLQGDLFNAEIEPGSHYVPSLAGRFFTTSNGWEAPVSRGLSILPGAESFYFPIIKHFLNLMYLFFRCCDERVSSKKKKILLILISSVVCSKLFS